MKTAIVHVGSPKTGSSSIQLALRASAEKLKAQGIFHTRDHEYPVQLLSMAFRRPKRQILKADGASAQDIVKAAHACWLSLSRKVRRENIPFTIISEEALLTTPQPERLKRLLTQIFDRVVIVAYIRDPISKFPSRLDQRIRGGATLGQFIKYPFGLLGDLRALDRYAHSFPSTDLVFRNFDPANLLNGSLIQDFQAVLSNIVGQPVELPEAFAANASMPAPVTAFLHADNERRVADGVEIDVTRFKQRRRLIAAIRRTPDLLQAPKLKLGPSDILDHLNTAYQRNNIGINERYLKDQVPFDVEANGKQMNVDHFNTALHDWIKDHRDHQYDLGLERIRDRLLKVH